MSDKFSLYQTDGLWGIIENASNEKQTSIKSYFGSDLIIKRLNEQADQINQLKQQNEELMLQLNRQNVEEHKPVYCTLAGTECEYLGKVEELKQQLAEKDKEIKKLRFDTQRYANDYREMALTRQIGMEHLAINELEKAKALLFSKAIQITGTGVDCVRLYEINKIINQQIKELKGEKDVED